MRYCQEKGIVCQYAGTNIHCRLTACVFPQESLYPTDSEGEHLMKCESCTKYDDCRTGSGLTWPCGAYRPNTGGGMDIENLIEDLRIACAGNQHNIMGVAATAFSTLQVENEKLRDELEQVKRLYESEKEDFIDFACSGVPNTSPYCMNRHPDCVDERGWCRIEKCRGFSRERDSQKED